MATGGEWSLNFCKNTEHLSPGDVVQLQNIHEETYSNRLFAFQFMSIVGRS